MTTNLPLQIEDVQRTTRALFTRAGSSFPRNSFPCVKAKFQELEYDVNGAIDAALELTTDDGVDREIQEFRASDATAFDSVLWRVDDLITTLRAFEEKVKRERTRLYGKMEDDD